MCCPNQSDCWIDFHKAQPQFCHVPSRKTSLSLLLLPKAKQRTPNPCPSLPSCKVSQDSPSTPHISLSGSDSTINLDLEFLKSPLRHCDLKVAGLLLGNWLLSEWVCQQRALDRPRGKPQSWFFFRQKSRRISAWLMIDQANPRGRD